MIELCPTGVPKYVRCYDNGGETADRYTVVLTGNYAGRDGCDYLDMSSNPSDPCGIGLMGWDERIIDKPKYSHLGRKIKFQDLAPDAQRCALEYYKEIWNLNWEEPKFEVGQKVVFTTSSNVDAPVLSGVVEFDPNLNFIVRVDGVVYECRKIILQ